jgi:hypothetical protein
MNVNQGLVWRHVGRLSVAKGGTSLGICTKEGGSRCTANVLLLTVSGRGHEGAKSHVYWDRCNADTVQIGAALGGPSSTVPPICCYMATGTSQHDRVPDCNLPQKSTSEE